jgi:octaprenyl-diphosphate synthase
MNLAVQVQERGDPAAALEPLMRLVQDEMGEVNRIILSQARSDVALIPELAQHLINSGGKRLRPMLTIGAAKLCGYRGDGHIKLAAAVEFMHTATLLHDDVVDESDMRRGKKSARLLWGNQASVLVGDFLLGQAFRMMVNVGSLGALKILSEASAIIAEGEVLQLAASKNMSTTEEDYLAVIQAKTAALFSAAAEIGAVITGHSAGEQAALRLYGTNIGLTFQLIDDALDYSGEAASLGKRVGDDFREGKITLPVVLSYRRSSVEERAFWRRTLQDGVIGDADLDEAIALMRRHNAIEETIERACLYGKEAREALYVFPKSEARTALLDAIDFSIIRMH